MTEYSHHASNCVSAIWFDTLHSYDVPHHDQFTSTITFLNCLSHFPRCHIQKQLGPVDSADNRTNKNWLLWKLNWHGSSDRFHVYRLNRSTKLSWLRGHCLNTYSQPPHLHNINELRQVKASNNITPPVVPLFLHLIAFSPPNIAIVPRMGFRSLVRHSSFLWRPASWSIHIHDNVC